MHNYFINKNTASKKTFIAFFAYKNRLYKIHINLKKSFKTFKLKVSK